MEFLGRAVQSNEFLERMLGNGLVIAEMDEFCFFTGNLIVTTILAEKFTQWFGGDSGGTIPLSPTIGILTYLNGYTVIPLVVSLIEK